LRRFEIVEAEVRPRSYEIAIVGELDLARRQELRAALDRISPEATSTLLDLSGCEFIDASTLALLVKAHSELSAKGCEVRLCGLHGQVLRLFKLTGLTPIPFEVATTEHPPKSPVAEGVKRGAPPEHVLDEFAA
jgi:anti-anti-sigma factor